MPVPPHPAFAKHFTDAIYDPDSDEGYDVLPFGTDLASDTFADWEGRSEILLASPRLATVLGTSPDQAPEEALEDVDAAEHLVSAAFTLLYHAGTINAPDRRSVLAVLRSRVEAGADETWERMADDLATFAVAGQPPRPARRTSKPWLVLAGGGNDPAHQAWLDGLAAAIMADPDWQTWWARTSVERLSIVPRPLGPPGGIVQFTDQGRTIAVLASSAELSRRFMELLEREEETLSQRIAQGADFVRPPASAHEAFPGAAELFRGLITTALGATARHLDMPAPPPTLPT